MHVVVLTNPTRIVHRNLHGIYVVGFGIRFGRIDGCGAVFGWRFT